MPDQKMLIVIYASNVEDRVTEVIDRLDLDGYTRLDQVQGAGGGTKRYGNKVWPGENKMRLVVDSMSKIDKLVAGLRDLQRSFSKPPAMKLFVVPVESVFL